MARIEVIEDSPKARSNFGWNYGGGISVLSPEMVKSLLSGRCIAIDINGGEYSEFLVLGYEACLIDNGEEGLADLRRINESAT